MLEYNLDHLKRGTSQFLRATRLTLACTLGLIFDVPLCFLIFSACAFIVYTFFFSCLHDCFSVLFSYVPGAAVPSEAHARSPGKRSQQPGLLPSGKGGRRGIIRAGAKKQIYPHRLAAKITVNI